MLLGLSIHLRDGMSIIAVVLLSLLSSLIGLGNYWELKLPKRKNNDENTMKGDGTNGRKWTFRSSNSSSSKKSVIKDEKRNTSCKLDTVERGIAPKEEEDHVPMGDVVIRYPKGNFLIVRCHENVARELYFAPEELSLIHI